ncbi:MAG: site-specific DNA-methyltransferase [Candidatus Marinimicrobia bacterium]|nr:site-specific DNA-methyltransferase [Candidatus Neomarinimicrobiota bacterium]
MKKSKLKTAKKFNKEADLILYEGDTLKLLKQIPGNFVKLVVTSPPYNIGKPYEKRLNLDEYLSQQKTIIEECYRVLKNSGHICWQVGNYVDNGEIVPLDILLYPIFSKLGLKLRNRIVWQFGHGLHATKRFSGRYEVILWFTKSDSYSFNIDPIRVPQKYPNKKYFKGPKKGQYSSNPLGKNPGDIWNIPNVKANHVEKTIHPCQFPVELIERLVLSMTEENDWVLDPFSGVGTTSIAALIHNRKAIGAEIDPEYMKIAKERIRKVEEGVLRIRPKEREVYDPEKPNSNLPPKTVHLKSTTLKLQFETDKN